ncbi:MAG: tetratricopeptide repeat protein, partial [bacterium]|nr:tetratricopeptide repeat protein [bacterium]
LAFLFYPAYKFWRLYFQNKVHKGVAAVFIGFIVAFFIQDLFVFETITTYVVLIFLCAFLSSGIPFESRRRELKLNQASWTVLAVLFLIAFLPMMWSVNIYPAKVNLQAAIALRSDPQTEDFFVIVDRFKKVISAGTYGQQEYRVQFVEFVDRQLAPVGEVIPEVKPVLSYTDELLVKQIAEQPNDAKNYLLAMRHYNYTYASLPDQKISRLQQALGYYPKLVELTPTRPHIHQEEGYSYLYLFKVYQQNKDAAAAKDAADNAEKYFQKAVDINPAVVESYTNLIMLYFNVGDDVKVGRVVELMDQRKVSFRSPSNLQKLLNLARASKRVKWVGYFSEELLKLQPDNVDAWINLALFYATSGDRQKALEIAQKIRGFGGDYIQQADAFVQSVNAGKYEKPQ